MELQAELLVRGTVVGAGQLGQKAVDHRLLADDVVEPHSGGYQDVCRLAVGRYADHLGRQDVTYRPSSGGLGVYGT